MTLYDLGTAFRAGHAYFFGYGPGVLTLRKVWTSKELTKPSVLIDHHCSAFIARYIGHLVLYYDLFGLAERLVKLLIKRPIELRNNRLPADISFLNGIQLGLHIRRKLYIDNILKVILHKLGDNKAKLGGNELFLFSDDISAVNNCGYGGRIGARAAYSKLFKRFDQRCFGIPCRRFSKILLGNNAVIDGFIPCFQLRKRRCFLAGLLVICTYRINGGKAVKELNSAACAIIADLISCGVYRGSNGFKYRFAHLTCKEALINELIQLILPCIKVGLEKLRGQCHIGGANGLMRILGVIPSAVDIRSGRNISRAILFFNVRPGSVLSFIGYSDRICSHIGDKSDAAPAKHINALIELLSAEHGTFGRHTGTV